MFDNRTMRQPVKGKPHIAFIEGYWRVSPYRRGVVDGGYMWQMAHNFVSRLNIDINYIKVVKHEH